jgi:phosphatidylglycerophosphate synthase
MDGRMGLTWGWAGLLLLYVGSGILIILLVLQMPRSFFVKYGYREYTAFRLRLFSPNYFTAYGLVFSLAGFFAFFFVHPYLGFQVTVLGKILDALDGIDARAIETAGIARSKLDKWIGTWFDPFSDKVGTLDYLVVFFITGYVSAWIAVPILLTAVWKTVSRSPFKLLPKLLMRNSKQGAMSQLMTEIGSCDVNQDRADRLGKLKAVVECIGIIAVVPYWLGWTDANSFIPNLVYGLALALGIASECTKYFRDRQKEQLA